MKYGVLARRAIGLGLGITALVAGSAQAATTVDTSACTAPLLSQPFASAGDYNWYTLVPGESPDSFNGTGWAAQRGSRRS